MADNILGQSIAIDQSVDGTTNKVVSTTDTEQSVADGNHFYVAGFETLNSDASAKFAVKPNADAALHMMFAVEGTTQLEFYIYEGATITAATGTPVTPFNNNRNSTNTSQSTLIKNPTITGAGTLIYSESSGLAGATPSRPNAIGTVTREREIILKANTQYVFELKSKAAGNILSYVGEWWETDI
jgi:hypothetical protein